MKKGTLRILSFRSTGPGLSHRCLQVSILEFFLLIWVSSTNALSVFRDSRTLFRRCVVTGSVAGVFTPLSGMRALIFDNVKCSSSLFICLFTYLFTYLVIIYLFIYLFIYYIYYIYVYTYMVRKFHSSLPHCTEM